MPSTLGNPYFKTLFKTDYAYMAGAMANGIASEALVMALGKANMLGSFGAAGCSLNQIASAIDAIKLALPDKPYCFNLIHSPDHPEHELATMQLYLKKNISLIEASAFLKVTFALVLYRVLGVQKNFDGSTTSHHRLIAKVSHPLVAKQFMEPPADALLKECVIQGWITEEIANAAKKIPLADAITIEADSGGHTDNQALVCLFPLMKQLRDEVQKNYHYAQPILLGAAGGIGTPSAMLAAFAMEADYVVTGSINQATVEAGTSKQVKQLLADATLHDVAMAPAPDMFEMGAKVQVLKRGSLFAMRAQKLYLLYQQYTDINDLPYDVKEDLEKNIFKKPLVTIWDETKQYLLTKNANVVEIESHPKKKLTAIFKWYMGLSSDWAIEGIPERSTDYQVWCGPSLGAFNAWAKNHEFASWQKRHVATIALQLLNETAHLQNKFKHKDSAKSSPIVQKTVPLNDAYRIEQWLKSQIAEELQVNPADIDIRQPFVNFNIDSAKSMLMLAKLEKQFTIKLSPVMVWNYPTIETLSARLAKLTSSVKESTYE